MEEHKECFDLALNYFELNFTPPRAENGNISEDFDYNKKNFVITKWVYEEIAVYTSDSDMIKQNIFQVIIDKYYEKAKVMKLDYLQKLVINREKCWLIDNWEYICLMFPEEY